MVDGLSEAIAASGLSQAAFATVLGTSASRLSTYCRGRTIPSATFFLRARRIGLALGAARAQGLVTPPVAMAQIVSALAEEDEIWAYKMVLACRDHLGQTLASAGRADAWHASPGRPDRSEWRALLAALVSREFLENELQPPSWAAPSRLDHDWVLSSPLYDEEGVRARTPAWLAERGVFVAERDLLTA